MKILILCTGNSCRSQMAEGFLKSIDNTLDVFSAGTEPASRINSKAVQVMNEIGIDISKQYPESVEQYVNENFDYVITVCDNAKETCPIFTGNVKQRLHIGFEDPYSFKGNEEDTLNKYREVRDLIMKEFNNFYKHYIIGGK
ncbi:MAG: protein tyrosine phosphatase [Ignavibacteria bacterium GWB2_35_12]|nr:MAG: protein tyrosine phosphatase [Ignavibacteria bacterium GWA2_35_8]OGU39062.1 MAG: protein tyrosine phosphatase [Ignavibacteria bacterium GWB2_35_12]OGU87909.1 MAG: protein tyrosine phosphatase [Ignavibacteria bacterium RIFOXYA2_FULL_35_10]OGV21771.1 MAG: protein tyrosine phosphatase [Ignavibacteria bacterium RIFOXYC2_FULL_35_21]